MRTLMLVSAVVLGLGYASVALADTPAAGSSEGLVIQSAKADVASAREGHVDVQNVADKETVTTTTTRSSPARGDMAWILAGAAGALVPLVLFALPGLWLAWFGPFAPLAFLVAIGVGTVATGLGGAATWLLQAIFSDLKSGFLVPILGAAAVGLGATFLGGVVAAGVIWGGVGLAWLASGAQNLWEVVMNPNLGDPLSSLPSTIMIAAVGLGFVTWAAGVLAASIGGPMVAAYLYRANGVPKYTEAAVPVGREADTYRDTVRDDVDIDLDDDADLDDGAGIDIDVR